MTHEAVLVTLMRPDRQIVRREESEKPRSLLTTDPIEVERCNYYVAAVTRKNSFERLEGLELSRTPADPRARYILVKNKKKTCPLYAITSLT